MAIRDIFLPLVGEPDAATIAAIDKCVAVAGDLGTRVTAMAVEHDTLVRPRIMISDDLENTATTEVLRSASKLSVSLPKVFISRSSIFLACSGPNAFINTLRAYSIPPLTT